MNGFASAYRQDSEGTGNVLHAVVALSLVACYRDGIEANRITRLAGRCIVADQAHGFVVHKTCHRGGQGGISCCSYGLAAVVGSNRHKSALNPKFTLLFGNIIVTCHIVALRIFHHHRGGIGDMPVRDFRHTTGDCYRSNIAVRQSDHCTGSFTRSGYITARQTEGC